MVPLPLSDCKILVVEDNYFLAYEMETWLRQSGAKVIGPVSSVSTALQSIDRQVPDLAVLDVNLIGGEYSFPVAERLSRLDIPYLFATGYGDLVAYHPTGRNRRVLTKPINCRELLAALGQLLVQKGLSGKEATVDE